jgi:hypothetical protein
MFIKKSIRLLSFLLIGLITNVSISNAYIAKKSKEKENEVQRTSSGVFDLQQNTVSNIQFYTTNYGIFGLNVARGDGGGYWPRGSRNQYIFGGGYWFGAEKFRPMTPADSGIRKLSKYVSISYNPNNARSWLVPGRVDTNVLVNKVDRNETKKYRTYFSTDFSPSDGTPFNLADGPNWPVWSIGGVEDTLKRNRYFGFYVDDPEERNLKTTPRGPSFISGEDIFSTYHDGDLTYYDGGKSLRESQGYPLHVQTEQMIYSWGFGDYQNFIFIRYDIINRSKDTLYNCWLAPIMDVDIARAPGTAVGASNDRVRYYNQDTTLNMAYQWSNNELGEANNGFGYLGFDFLESPAVIRHFEFDTVTQQQVEVIKPDTRFVRKDRKTYPINEQLGLVTFRNWSIADDKLLDLDRYLYISSGVRDDDTGPGDKRYMMGTGPYHLRPGDTSKVVVGIIIANASKGKDPDGSPEDTKGLATLDRFAQTVYDNNFQAPKPPDRSKIIGATAMNHGVTIKWDAAAELTVDDYEGGLDFMGYRIYRARRSDLDTFYFDNVAGTANYPKGVGPLGWKQIAQYNLPEPFQKSTTRSIPVQNATAYPFLDSMSLVGAFTDGTGKVIDTMTIRVMKIGQGFVMVPDSVRLKFYNNLLPRIIAIDTSSFRGEGNVPWAPYYLSLLNGQNFPVTYDPKFKTTLFDSICVGNIRLNKALVPYNPLYFKRQTIKTDAATLVKAKGAVVPGIFHPTYQRTDTLKSKVDITKDSLDAMGKPVTIIRTVEDSRVDSVYFINSVKYVGTEIVIDVLYPRPLSQQMNDLAHYQEVSATMISMIQNGYAKLDFPDFEQSYKARQEIIGTYMDKITNGRSFFDIGDDDKNGVVDIFEDVTKSERMVNGIPYYYKVLAYDLGYPNQQTPNKLNDAQIGLPNLATVYPQAASAGNDLKFEIIAEDRAKLGGLSNFNFFAVDEDRALQNFAGDTLELSFEPAWNLTSYESALNKGERIDYGSYYRNISLVNLSKKKQVLFNSNFAFEQNPCATTSNDILTDNTASIVQTAQEYIDEEHVDPKTGLPYKITLGMKNNRTKIPKSGKFTTGNFNESDYCYTRGMQAPAYGALGFSFDFNLIQEAGMFRPDSLMLTDYKVSTNASTRVNFIDDAYNNKTKVMNVQYLDQVSGGLGWFQPAPATQFPIGAVGNRFSFPVAYGLNNGPGEYLVEFLPGGSLPMKLSWGSVPAVGSPNTKEADFDVEYLNVKITNIKKNEVVNSSGTKLTVEYPGDIPHVMLDTAPRQDYGSNAINTNNEYFPHPLNIAYLAGDGKHPEWTGKTPNDYIGKYNLTSYAWVNARRKITALNANQMFGRPAVGDLRYKQLSYSGSQGKYLKSTRAKGDTSLVDFVNIINIGGVQYALDYANIRRTVGPDKKWDADDSYVMGEDFKVGDKILLKSTGGPFGLPTPGAKVRVVVSGGKPADGKYSNSMLDNISIAPNPYFITHDAQRSAYDAKIYFSKLPNKCTIEIFTLTGDLVQTINHDDANSTGEKVGMDIWDLITKNKQRVQSQTLLAIIKTPDGSETIKKFSLVVGGFQLLDQ